MFSWPVSSPFAILHADLWIPGHHTNRNGYMTFMDVMCNMSHFVVVIPVTDESSATLVSYFIQHLLLKCVLWYLVILDDGTPF